MRTKITFLSVILLCTTFISFAQHTFSIVAVDTTTGEIGSAGATCIAAQNGAQTVSDIVLGVGAIHTQSAWHPTNQNNARARMVAGDSPQEIIDWLTSNDINNNPTTRQYNIVDLNNGNPRTAAYTGSNCYAEYKHINGTNYSIAGNILISEEVIDDMETAFLNNTGSLADKLMAALQGAKRAGADSRCLNNGVSSYSAFIRVADPSDTDSSYGNLSLDLNVWVVSTVFEPIDALQDAYDATLSNTKISAKNKVGLFPNPSNKSITLSTANSMITAYEISDVLGKVIRPSQKTTPKNHLYMDVSGFVKGIYFIKLQLQNSTSVTKKFIVE